MLLRSRRPFDTTNRRDLAIWLDYSQASSFTVTSNDVSATTNLGYLGGVFDSSSSGERPDYLATGYNGLPCVDFVGNRAIRCELPAVKAFNQFTMVVVYQNTLPSLTPPSTVNEAGRFWCVGGFTGNQLLIGDANAALSQGVLQCVHNASSAYVKGVGVNFQKMNHAVGTSNILTVATGGGRGTEWYRNGRRFAANLGMTEQDFDPVTLGVTHDWVCVGGRLTGATGASLRRLRARVAEFRIYNRALSATEVARVSAELQRKWAVPAAAVTPTIGVAGQSNARGLAVPAEAPTGYDTSVTGSQIWFGANTSVMAPADLTTDNAQGTATGATSFGAEISLSRDYNTNQGANVIVKHAADGTSLGVDWNPTTTPIGSQLATFLSRADEAIDRANNLGLNSQLTGMLWVQGERDCTTEVSDELTNQYEFFLTKLIEMIRNRYGVSDMPFVIAILTADLPVESHPKRATIVAAQRAVAATLKNVYLIETDDLVTTDNIHYDTDSYIALGVAASQAIRTRQNVTATLI